MGDAVETREQRNARWVQEFRAGVTIGEIGRRDGFTRAMVHIVVKSAGLTRHDGGARVRVVRKTAIRDQERLEKQAATERRRGLPRGVTKQSNGRTYSARYAGKHLSNHYTAEEAAAARRAYISNLGRMI